MFDAYLACYRAETQDLLRLATSGSGVLPEGALHPDLVARLAEEAGLLAQQFFTGCLRAFDYLPPVDVTFEDFLRAIVTADIALSPSDDTFRVAVIEGCRRFGIFPGSAGSLGDDAVALEQLAAPIEGFPVEPRIMLDILRDLDDPEYEGVARRPDGTALTAGTTLAWQRWHTRLLTFGRTNRDELGLDPRFDIRVENMHPTIRQRANGRPTVDLVVHYLQERPDLDPDVTGPVPVAGATVIGTVLGDGARNADRPTGRVLHVISKSLPADRGGRRRGTVVGPRPAAQPRGRTALEDVERAARRARERRSGALHVPRRRAAGPTPGQLRRARRGQRQEHLDVTAVRVRMYRVGFGDCFLVTIGEGDEARRILIDCGRHAGSRPPGTGEATFAEVVAGLVDDIAAESGDTPRLDVVVATHRHRDHVHGFKFAELWKRVVVKEVWLPWIEDLDDPGAGTVRRHQQELAERTFHALRAFRAAGSQEPALDDAIEIAYNCTTNAEAFTTLRHGFHEDSPRRLRYLPRPGRQPDELTEDDGDDVLPSGVTVHVLGPSRDPAVIKRLDPPDGKGYLQLLPVDATLGSDEEVPDTVAGTVPMPFGAKWRLAGDEVAQRYGLSAEQIEGVRSANAAAAGDALSMVYRIDNAINGTSLVLLIEVGAVKLLFTGDAQWGTWQQILGDTRSRELLQGTTLFKVGHHGSRNATPPEFVKDFLGEHTKVAMVPVDTTKYPGEWQSIPKDTLLGDLLEHKVPVVRSDRPEEAGGEVEVGPNGAWIEIRLTA